MSRRRESASAAQQQQQQQQPDNSWWGWLKSVAGGVAGHLLKELLKDVGAHVAAQSAVAFLASHDPDMSAHQKRQLNDMLIRAYYAWKQDKPVAPMLRGVIALIVADPEKANAMFQSIVGVFSSAASGNGDSGNAGAAGRRSSSAIGRDRKVDNSYFPPPPSQPAPGAAASAAAAAASAAPPAAAAAAAKRDSSAAIATAKPVIATGTHGPPGGAPDELPPQPSAPPLYPQLPPAYNPAASPAPAGGSGAGTADTEPSAPVLDAKASPAAAAAAVAAGGKDLKVDAKTAPAAPDAGAGASAAAAAGAAAKAGAPAGSGGAEPDLKALLLNRYGIARARVEAIPGGLYPALVTALRDNPSCAITLDDCVGPDGRVVPGVSALFQFGHGNGKYFCFLYKSLALDEWFGSKPFAKPTNPTTCTPIDLSKQRFRLS